MRSLLFVYNLRIGTRSSVHTSVVPYRNPNSLYLYLIDQYGYTAIHMRLRTLSYELQARRCVLLYEPKIIQITQRQNIVNVMCISNDVTVLFPDDGRRRQQRFCFIFKPYTW